LSERPAAVPDYNSGPALRAFLERRGLAIRKKWGQHFLVNPRARAALAAALDIKSGEGVWEIGPGLGAMTAPLLDRGARVRAFEVDPGFAAILSELFAGAAFTLVPGDVMATWKTHDDSSPFLLGNLPYTIAAVLIGNLIENGRFFRRMVITVQKEVARRMAARPGGRDYSSISVLCASAYDIKPLLKLDAASFYPQPRVDSAALLFKRRESGPLPSLFVPLTRSLFAFRRKTIANNLELFLSQSCILKADERMTFRETGVSVLEQCGIAPKERAEKLSFEAFAALASALEETASVSMKTGCVYKDDYKRTD
jgi:16S rRNA (adenine1518-N6/adenine1519-N6)-dimethyltransferase